MGIIFSTASTPRVLPERDDGLLPFKSVTFLPQYQQSKPQTRGAKPQVANIGDDYWLVQYATYDMHWYEALAYQAWLHSLRGGMIPFCAWHPLLRYPINYRNGFAGLTRVGGGAFDGTCKVYGFAETLDAITLSNLPEGFTVAIGDRFSVPFGSLQLLHEVVSGGVAAANGRVTLAIEPTLPISFVASTDEAPVTATFNKPWMLASLDASSVQGPFEEGLYGAVSFSAVQI